MSMAEQHQQKLQDLPEAIRPIYTTPNPNDRVLLYEGDIEVHQSNQPRTTENGSLYISCLPNFDVDFELPEIEGNIYNDEDVHLKIPSINLSGDAFLRNVVFGNKHACTGTFRKPVYRGNLALSDCIIFHVINFPGYAGEHIRDSEATTFWNGRLNMQSSTWVLTLDRVREGGQLIKALKREGGFAITHVGKVARTDGQQVQLQ